MPKAKEKSRNNKIHKEDISDSRFIEANIDPRFKTLPQKKTKISIDKRFSKIFTEKSKFDNADDLYQLDQSQNESSSKSEISNNDSESLASQISEFEQDEPIKMTESSSNRIALQNYDWEQLRATDLFILFDSLAKSSSTSESGIKKVEVYMSDYGYQRIEEEKLLGPKELSSALVSENPNESRVPNQELLFKYERNKLKYYYAIVHFNDVKTAEYVYNNYDDVEFEFTGCQLDLRFVPEQLSVHREPSEVCTEVSEKDRLNSKVFVTQSIAHSNVKLTWDKPSNRNTNFLFDKDEVERTDLLKIVDLDESVGETDFPVNDNFRNTLLMSSDQKAFGDFDKKKRGGATVAFKVGFGDSATHANTNSTIRKREYNPFRHIDKHQTENEVDDDFFQKTDNSSKHKSKKEFIRIAKNKKIEKKLQKAKDNEELELLVDDNHDLITKRKINDFKPNYDDPRFKAVLDNPDFQIDPTNPQFGLEKNQFYIQNKKLITK
jgi:hypothetical protein